MRHAGLVSFLIGYAAGPSAYGQPQSFYSGSNVTGQLVLVRTVNLLQQAQPAPTPQFRGLSAEGSDPQMASPSGPRGPGMPEVHPTTSLYRRGQVDARERVGTKSGELLDYSALSASLGGPAPGRGSAHLTVGPSNSNALTYAGLTHADQRNANGGNQFSVEPPSPALAVGNGFVLEGVNNAVQVYNISGVPLLPSVVSSNQLFGLPPAINRATGVYGPFPTDMRVFYDSDINRWFVLQWVAVTDSAGNPLPQSQEWFAVSQTSDPTGTYNIYMIDTTDAANPACGTGGCVPDYPQIGADRYGFYICSNEFAIFDPQLDFRDATIVAISKGSLAAGTSTPTTYRFLIPNVGGPEFAIQPTAVPPGASPFLAGGGLEYFVSSQSTGGTSLAIWAMYNTSSLSGSNPSLSLTRVVVPTLSYSVPNAATQRPGPQTLLSFLPLLDGGDCRVLSASYARARLYVTVATSVTDGSGNTVVGGAYFLLSPTFRNGSLAANVLSQGYLVTTGDHLLRPVWAVNSQGQGALAVTLVGPDYYPSAAYIPVDASSPLGVVQLGTIQVAAPGLFPEDGFSAEAYGVARWGDDSAGVAAGDGSIWMAPEYIPAVRTPLADWGTVLTQYKP